MTALVLLGLVVVWSLGLGEPVARDYDEGVYLVSARLLLQGHPLFTEVFSSQPPLFLDLLLVAFRFLGDTVAGGRALCLVAGVGCCAAVASLARARLGAWAGPVAAALTGLPVLFFHQARTVQAEMPAVALGAVALALVASPSRAARPALQAAAGACFGLALCAKLLLLPWALPLALALWPPGRLESRVVLGRAVVAGGAAVVAFVLPFAFHGLAGSWEQVFGFHLAAREVVFPDFSDNTPWSRLLREDRAALATGGLGLAVLARRHRLEAAGLAAWLASSAAFLWLHTPLFHHHLLLLVPPLGLAGAGLVAAPLRLAAPILGLTALSSVASWWETPAQPSAEERAAVAAGVKALQALEPATAPVVTDQQFLAFLAGRTVPPALCDTSFVRVATGSLRLGPAVEATAGAAGVLFWSGRLERLQGYRAWVEAHGTQVGAWPEPARPGRSLWALRH